MPGALAVVKFSGRKSSDRKCSNNDLKEIFAKSNSISWGEFLRSSDRKCHTYGLKETVVKSNAYSQEQNFKGENGGGICQNKNTKCPIDAHCHRHCRRDPRITKYCIEVLQDFLTLERSFSEIWETSWFQSKKIQKLKTCPISFSVENFLRWTWDEQLFSPLQLGMVFLFDDAFSAVQCQNPSPLIITLSQGQGGIQSINSRELLSASNSHVSILITSSE